MALGSGPDVRFRTKQEYVYQSLRGAIMRGELAPGQRLVIDDIGRRLQVSAIPIREALQLLQSEGLVLSAPHVGATVAPVSEDEVHEVFAIMEGLETVAVREAARRLDDAGTALLSGVVAEMDAALAAQDYERWADLNGDLHRPINEIAADAPPARDDRPGAVALGAAAAPLLPGRRGAPGRAGPAGAPRPARSPRRGETRTAPSRSSGRTTGPPRPPTRTTSGGTLRSQSS